MSEKADAAMLRAVRIKNFKGLTDVEIPSLARLNVLVGPNGTGKTALLEALFLASGASPEIVLRTRQWRGWSGELTGGDFAALLNELFEGIFGDRAKDAAVNLTYSDGSHRNLRVRHIEPRIEVSGDGSYEGEAGLEFSWKTDKREYKTRPKFSSRGMQYPLIPDARPVHMVAARTPIPESQTATLLSRMRIGEIAERFDKVFRSEFPALDEISVEAPYGPPIVYARLDRKKRLPLSEISGGISQLAGLLAIVGANPGGLVMLDEIENGFYYTNYGSIWRSLFELAEANQTQLVVTTHSYECLQALSAALDERHSDVAFLRTRRANAEVSIDRLDGATLFKALEFGEVR